MYDVLLLKYNFKNARKLLENVIDDKLRFVNIISKKRC